MQMPELDYVDKVMERLLEKYDGAKLIAAAIVHAGFQIAAAYIEDDEDESEASEEADEEFEDQEFEDDGEVQ